MNGDFTYPSTGRTDNQLRTFAHVGLLNPAPNEADIPNFLKSVAVSNATVPVQYRMRSWIDANCSHCHRPGGLGPGYDGRLYTPYENQDLMVLMSGSVTSKGRRFMSVITPWMTAKCRLWPRTWWTKRPWLFCVSGSQVRSKYFRSISIRTRAISWSGSTAVWTRPRQPWPQTIASFDPESRVTAAVMGSAAGYRDPDPGVAADSKPNLLSESPAMFRTPLLPRIRSGCKEKRRLSRSITPTLTGHPTGQHRDAASSRHRGRRSHLGIHCARRSP